jgi:hypothetical protein
MPTNVSLHAKSSVGCAVCVLVMAFTIRPALAGPHQHGVGYLDLALEAGTLTVELRLPLESVVGFERAPRTDAERQTAREALAHLREPSRVVAIDPVAGCAARPALVQAPRLEAGAAPGSRSGSAPVDEGHGDLSARYVWQCATPASLRSVQLQLFDRFPRLRRLEAQAALPQGQTRAVLRSNARNLPLAR